MPNNPHPDSDSHQFQGASGGSAAGHCSPSLLTPDEIATLNPGIRHTVQTLRGWGFDTRDSGDGVTHEFPCDLPHPYVHILTAPENLASETDRLVTLLEKTGINFDNCPHPQIDPEGMAKHPWVEASYLPSQGYAVIQVMNVVIRENMNSPEEKSE